MIDIYPTSPDPQLCAKALDDKTLSGALKDVFAVCGRAIRHHGGVAPFGASTPRSEQWDTWARDRYANFEWLNVHLMHLSFEWRSRGINLPFHVNHGNFVELTKQRHVVPNTGPQTPFPNCTRFQSLLDPMVAYRVHLSEKWLKAPEVLTWGKNGLPPPPWALRTPEDYNRILTRLGLEPLQEMKTCN